MLKRELELELELERELERAACWCDSCWRAVVLACFHAEAKAEGGVIRNSFCDYANQY